MGDHPHAEEVLHSVLQRHPDYEPARRALTALSAGPRSAD
jgi:hypothetical protein